MHNQDSSSVADGDLMERAARGDGRAYAALFGHHAERIRRVSYLLLHDSASAEDAVQETFTKGLAALSSYRGDSDPGAWFYAIALNVCRRMLRDEKIREERVHPEHLEKGRKSGSPRRGVITSVLRRETERQLSLALGYLTEPQKEVFVLHYVEGLPYEKIAEALQITVGAARALGFRARSVLQEKIPRNVFLTRGS